MSDFEAEMEAWKAQRREVRVVCNEESHAPKVSILARITWSVDSDHPPGWSHPIGQHFLSASDEVLDRRKLWGDAASGPDPEYATHYWNHRSRLDLRCPLCGLTVPLRAETAKTLADGLQQSGVSSISLSALAATLS